MGWGPGLAGSQVGCAALSLDGCGRGHLVAQLLCGEQVGKGRSGSMVSRSVHVSAALVALAWTSRGSGGGEQGTRAAFNDGIGWGG